MADAAHSAEPHPLKGSSPPSGAPPAFEPIFDSAASPTPKAKRRDADQLKVIRHANRVAATAREEAVEVEKLCELEEKLDLEGPRKPGKPAKPPTRQTIVDTSTATETVLTVINPKGDDPAWVEWQRAVDAAEAIYARDREAFILAIGLDEQRRVCDRLHNKLVHQARALTAMKAGSPAALGAKANAWIEIMIGGGFDGDSKLALSIALDAAQIGINGDQSNPLIDVGHQEAAPPDRRALEAYAEWLHMEQRLLAIELYPELGDDAVRFVPHNTAASHFHFGGDRDWRDVPKPSTRAERILSILGIDWTTEDEATSARRHETVRDVADGLVRIVGKVA